MKSFLLDLSNDKKKKNLKSKKVSKNLLDLFKSQNVIHKKIGVFHPLADEADILSEIRSLNLLFPKIISKDGGMIFKESQIEELVEEEFLGKVFKVPSCSAPIYLPEVMVIPGLAFDRKGQRLGRGKGFYDRYLENFLDIKIGVCFHQQLLSELPTEKHDQRVGILVTDKEIIII